jgi:uncharacterized protein (TIGR03067 family)
MRIRSSVSAVALALLVGSAAALGQDAKKGAPELQGTWKIVSHVTNREGNADVPANLPRWVIKGDTVRYAGETLATLAVDPANMPKTIDLHFPGNKHTYEGIYKINGDTLTICVNKQNANVKERPLDFDAETKEDRQVLVLEKQKPGSDDGTKDAPGFVGIQIANAPDNEGVLIAATIDKSPAKKAGLQKDDVVLRVGDTPATGVRQVVDLIRAVRAGTDLTLRVRRGEKEMDVTVRCGVIPFFLLE